MISLRDLLTGPPAYRANTPWKPIGAIGTVALIMLVQTSTPLLLYGLSPALYQTIGGEARPPNLSEQFASPMLELVKVAVAGILVGFAAGVRGGNRRAVFALLPVEGGASTCWLLAGLTFLVMASVNLLIWGAAAPFFHVIQARTALLAEVMSPWLTAIVIVIAAPLVEELLFRGFLLSAIAKSRIGFWGAALVSDAAWTMMHAAVHPWTALPSHFILGLVFSFILWRTGSLWACIFAHAANNIEPALVTLIFNYSRFTS